MPRLTDKKGEPLSVIEGQPPDLKQDINFCPFAMRCDKAMRICAAQIPAVTQIGNHHYVKCWLEHELAPKGEA